VRTKCFARCVTKPGTSLSGSESSCVSRCVERYIEATQIISRAIFNAPRWWGVLTRMEMNTSLNCSEKVNLIFVCYISGSSCIPTSTLWGKKHSFFLKFLSMIETANANWCHSLSHPLGRLLALRGKCKLVSFFIASFGQAFSSKRMVLCVILVSHLPVSEIGLL